MSDAIRKSPIINQKTGDFIQIFFKSLYINQYIGNWMAADFIK